MTARWFVLRPVRAGLTVPMPEEAWPRPPFPPQGGMT
jgi:hypothetical protein